MFTGLVEGRATVREVLPEGAAVRLVLDMPAEFLPDARLGDSIALNGCCLTVVAIDKPALAFQAGTETLSKTNLGELRPGSPSMSNGPSRSGPAWAATLSKGTWMARVRSI